MKSINETIDATYEAILAEADNPRQIASLERIKVACDYLSSASIRISLPAIERYCLDRGFDGPKAQSIRNSEGVLYKYARLRIDGQSVHKRKKKASVAEAPKIHDESIRAYVNLVEQERDLALQSLKRVESAVSSMPSISVDDILKIGRGEDVDIQTTALPSAALKTAVRNLLDPQRLSNCGLEIYKGRLVHSATRNILLEKDDFLALQTNLEKPSKLTNESQ